MKKINKSYKFNFSDFFTKEGKEKIKKMNDDIQKYLKKKKKENKKTN